MTLERLLKGGRFGALARGNALRAVHGTIWQQVAGDALRQCSRLSTYREGQLTIMADHATAVSQLRYLQRILLQQLRNHAEFKDLKQLRFVVGSGLTAPVRRPAKTRPTLSKGAAQHLLQAAELAESVEISNLFKRLASRAGSPGQ